MFFRLFIFWYVCGVILLSFDLLPSWLEWSNAVFLMLAGGLAIIYFIKLFNRKNALLISSVIFISTFFIEFSGSAYGVLFGEYYYTDRFAPNLFNVPIAIGFAWLMVMATSHVLAKRIVSQSGLLYALMGSAIAVIIDLIIDPVAYQIKQYWIWEGSGLYYGIPFSNFLGWFAVAFVLHLFLWFMLHFTKHNHPNLLWEKRMMLLYVLMISMFVLLGIIGKLWVASALTAILTSLVMLLALRRKTV
ncbi:hypothetical protein CD798_09510 [Bacillaceae bacterium SAOS 7]|nr:hypothetical protein CD798_09510 [Bacillaceae bacterium SAOS 7]